MQVLPQGGEAVPINNALSVSLLVLSLCSFCLSARSVSLLVLSLCSFCLSARSVSLLALSHKRRSLCRSLSLSLSGLLSLVHRHSLYIVGPPWRQPGGKWMVALVNSHTAATSKRWHLWEIDLRFALNSTPGWLVEDLLHDVVERARFARNLIKSPISPPLICTGAGWNRAI